MLMDFLLHDNVDVYSVVREVEFCIITVKMAILNLSVAFISCATFNHIVL